MKLTEAAILVSRGMEVLQAALAAYPYRYPARIDPMVSDIPMNLLQSDDWIASVCNSGDTESVREIMVRCAETMLPYWEARFNKDESMSQLTAAMRQFSSNPNPEWRRTL